MSASLRKRLNCCVAAKCREVPLADQVHRSKQRALLGGIPVLHTPRHSNYEGRTTTGLALDRDVAAHHLAEPPADDEPKTRAAVLARRGRGRLGKLLEQLAHLLRRHADASIGYCHRDPVTAVLLSLMSGDGDSAFLCELVGVARQV